MSETDLSRLHTKAWDLISAATGTPFALATSKSEGGASVRMVVLRRVNRERETIEFWTHAASDKIAEIANDATGEALFWNAELQTQIRASLRLSMTEGRDDDWETMGDGSRLNYAESPLPGTPIPSPDSHTPAPNPEYFRRITGQIVSMDVLILAPLPQRRAKFGPQGQEADWVAP